MPAEPLFSPCAFRKDIEVGHGIQGSVQAEADDKPREDRAQVPGSFSQLEGGLLDETFVHTDPWMLDRSSTRNMPMASVILSTQPHRVATALQFRLLSTVPVLVPRVPQGLLAGAAVIIDGLLTCPIFNGLTGTIDSYDVEANRYNVLLPLMDRICLSCCLLVRCARNCCVNDSLCSGQLRCLPDCQDQT